MALALCLNRTLSEMAAQLGPHAGSSVDELEGVVGFGMQLHAGNAGRLDIPAGEIESVADDCAGQAVSGYRHHR
jgi:hypothetical protein